MFSIIITLAIIVCVALILIVLIQNPKGGGIASNFSAGSQIMGVKRTNELVEKLTWGLAIALLVLTLSSNLFLNSSNDTVEESVLQDQIEREGLPMNATPSLDEVKGLNQGGQNPNQAEQVAQPPASEENEGGE